MAALAVVWPALTAYPAQSPSRPNVILILTDDQGWGDVGFHGNPHLKTPHLDALAAQSVELTQFYVSPVCSPTRASLMTGRYNYRTGAIDTFLGRSTMAADEVTLAEMFASAGYRTGIFGKWHLGDNYPSRPFDQGFDESLVHRGGGMVQPADPPGGGYFDPILVHNGKQEKARGYCSDVFTDAAIEFIEKHKDQPLFAYLAFNAPHTPLQVPNDYHQRYQSLGLDDATARVYGMVANIDDNLGRLLARLKALGLDERTIVIFMTDNGPQQPRYNGILRDRKGSVYDGGIHVPCLVRWPGRLRAGAKVAQVAAHIDIAPTLVEACGIDAPAGVRFDGTSLLAALEGKEHAPERLLFFQWHRGDVPVRYRACAVRGPRYKLVQAAGRADAGAFTPEWALYDMESDPAEQHNVIEQHRALADEMKAAYDRWFDDVGSTRGYPAPRIVAGTTHENPLTLTRQDWRGERAGWGGNGLGHWDVEFAAGEYDVTLRVPAESRESTARLAIGDIELVRPLPAGSDRVVFRGLTIPAGTARVEGTFGSERAAGVHYVDLESRHPSAK
jgi:arylsulfatase A-like enzyme